MCSTLPDPANGIIVYNTSEVYSSAFEVGATARYQCNPGNGFNTNATVVSPVRTCQSGTGGPSGVWTGKALSCSGMRCFMERRIAYSLYLPDEVKARKTLHACVELK